jgi:hypothetical protein
MGEQTVNVRLKYTYSASTRIIPDGTPEETVLGIINHAVNT